MNKMILFVLIASASLMLLSGCTGQTYTSGNSTNNSQGGQNGAATSVSIKNFAFNPPTATIAKGGTVTWTNDDQVTHTVTGSGFGSGQLSPGQSYSFTFNEAGTFTYHCSIHTSMTGSVIVK